MSDLREATTRLTEAIGALEASLATEREEARAAAQALAEARAAEAAATQRAEALSRHLDATRAEGEAAVNSLRAHINTLEDAAAAPTDAGMVDELNARLEDAERARDRAIDAAEEAARELAAARDEIAKLNEARTDDAKLREEAAEALDAAIGELRILGGVRRDG